jgi:23S rRNA (guanine745-N1)-methyltransferase
VQPLRRHAYAALRCPICRADIDLVGRSLCCQRRHTFDLARSGYVNLAVGRLAKAGGDTVDQLQRRRAFLASGAFDFIADAIVAHTRRQRSRATPLVLDAGCGTGYHLDRVTRGLAAETGRPCAGLGIDLARDAVRMAAGDHKALAFAVADVWSEWPVGSAAADLLINVFAPKNFSEMARTLRHDGQLAMAYAGPEHLIELREMLGLMDPQPGKEASYRRQMQGLGAGILHDRLRRSVQMSRDQALDLILMGPNARHISAAGIPAWSGSKMVTFDVELLVTTVI